MVTFEKMSTHVGICFSFGAFPYIQTSAVSGLFHVCGASVVFVGNGPVALRFHVRLSKPVGPAIPLCMDQTSGAGGLR